MMLRVWAASLLIYSSVSIAQEAVPPRVGPAVPEGFVKIELPDDVELKVLVKYVSDRLGINILFDESIGSKKVTLRAPAPIPSRSLLGLLETTLRAKGLALVDDSAEGWKRIVEASTIPEFSKPVGDAGVSADELIRPVTQVFPLKTISAQRAEQVVKPFLSKVGGTSVPDDETRSLIITDFGSNLRRIERLLEWVDQSPPPVESEFVDVKNMGAVDLAGRVTQLMAARSKTRGSTAAAPFEIASEDRTNQLFLVGPRELLDEIKELVKRLDVPLDLVTETYTFRYVKAERIERFVKQIVPEVTGQRGFSTAVDADGNMLIVTATPDIHRRIVDVTKRLDVAGSEAQSPIRFYQLRNASVDEVLATIRSIEGGSSNREPKSGQAIRQRMNQQRSLPPGPNNLPPAIGNPARQPPVLQPMSYQERTSATDAVVPATPGSLVAPAPMLRGPEQTIDPEADGEASESGIGMALGQAQVTSDPNSNTIIVVAPPEVHQIYADLIKRLDRRRPQVLVEITIVTVDANDQFSFGVDLSGGDRTPIKRLFAFTSYGLSQVNPVTGALSIIPGRGFNGTLVDPSVADAVLRALATHSRARVLAAPRVLVNDNATGVLTSVNQFPFSSVNASTTVATTSFGGFSDAGTTISVTPRIAEGDHLQLNVAAELSSFTGTGSAGLPPPKQNNSLESDVTVPDGYTVILGGLKFTTVNRRQETVPFLEYVPIVKYLVSLYTGSSATTQIYFFIKPIILRDDQFLVLKHYSERDLCRAKLPQDLPPSEPVLVCGEENRVSSMEPEPTTSSVEDLNLVPETVFPDSEPLSVPEEAVPVETEEKILVPSDTLQK
jgi:type II secretory pathway component GspD/PulD (secretin)